jgi:peptide/nickel transport system permease protein
MSEGEAYLSSQLVRLRSFWRLYRESTYGLAGLGILSAFLLLALLADLLSPYDPSLAVGPALARPDDAFPLGTDQFGRDILSLLIHGSRISLLVGFAASFIAVLAGTSIGLVAGYYGGILDSLLMRTTDLFIILPSLPLMLVLVAILGPGLLNIILAIAIVAWTGTARMIRSQTLSIKQRGFVEAVRVLGATSPRLIFRHILPNVAPLALANVILVTVDAILSEAGLSFLGFGDPFRPSWGMMLRLAFQAGAVVNGLWWYIVPPGLCVMLLVLGFSFISYSMDQILNPRLRRK